MADAPINVTKITLGTGKIVLLRELQIKHQELAAIAAAPRANDNPAVLAMLMQKELIKLLLVKVNDKMLRGSDVEDLDSLFTFAEFSQLNQALGQLGGTGEKKFQIEASNFSGS